MQAAGSKIMTLRTAANGLRSGFVTFAESQGASVQSAAACTSHAGATRSFWLGRCARRPQVVHEVMLADPFFAPVWRPGAPWLRSVLESWQNDTRLLGEEFWSDFRSVKRALNEAGTCSMRARVADTDHHYKLIAEIPGVPRENVKIKVLPEGTLEINATRIESAAATTEAAGTASGTSAGSTATTPHSSEFRFRSLFRLPPEVDREAIRASVKDGVLEVTLPKVQSPELAAKEVEVLGA